MKCIPLLCQVLEEEPPWFCVMNRLRHRYLLRRRETGLIFLNNPNIHHACLALSWRRSLSYRNQSIDLLCKSIDWFLYDRGLRHERVETLYFKCLLRFWVHLWQVIHETIVLKKFITFVSVLQKLLLFYFLLIYKIEH